MPRDLLQMYPSWDRALTLRTTEDDSATRLQVAMRDRWSSLQLELSVQDAQLLAGRLLQWLVDNGHDLPELPAVEDDLELADENLPDRNSEPPPVEQAGTFLVRREGDRVVIAQADPWVVVSASLLRAMDSGTILGASRDGETFTVEDSDGRRALYVVARDAGLGSKLCRLASWRPAPEQPAGTVHVVPEHTRTDVVRTMEGRTLP